MSSAPTIGVLALQGDVREHLHMLSEVGAKTVAVRRRSELDAVDAVVIPGGESTTIEKLLRIFDLFDPLRARLAAGMPAYGSCAGMIMLADRVVDAMAGQGSLGGIDITVRRNAFGRQVDSFEANLELAEIEDPQRPLRAVFIRAPWVESAGDRVEVLATVPTGDGDRIVAVRQGALLATSFHPELTGDARVHRLFIAMVHGRT